MYYFNLLSHNIFKNLSIILCQIYARDFSNFVAFAYFIVPFLLCEILALILILYFHSGIFLRAHHLLHQICGVCLDPKYPHVTPRPEAEARVQEVVQGAPLIAFSVSVARKNAHIAKRN